MELATIDYWYLLREWQALVGGRIQKIYMKERMLLLQIYSKQNYTLLCRDDESFLTTAKIQFPQTPPGYAMFLRKRIQGGRIRAVELVGFDRILRISVETKDGLYELIVELFQKMNIMLCKEGKIISAWETHTYTDRAIRGGAQYAPPKSRPAPWDADTSVLAGKEAARGIATELGIGGKYSEEICSQLSIDKKKELTAADAEKVRQALLTLKEKPLQPVYNEKEALPYPFKTREATKEAATFNEAIDAVERDTLETAELVAKQAVHKERQTKQEKIISAQRKQLRKLEETAQENQKKGELIYENYAELAALLEQIKKDWKQLDRNQLKEKYEDHPRVKAIDPDGTIEVEL